MLASILTEKVSRAWSLSQSLPSMVIWKGSFEVTEGASTRTWICRAFDEEAERQVGRQAGRQAL